MKILRNEISTEVVVKAPVETIWKLWTTPVDVARWNNMSEDWHSPKVDIDLKKDGNFFFRMELKDGSFGFDHAGKYDEVIRHELIEYTGMDGRKSIIKFIPVGNAATKIIETFEPDSHTPFDLQKEFCQAILNSFKMYAENNNQ